MTDTCDHTADSDGLCVCGEREFATAVCPECEPDNPAARYADRCFPHRVKDELPAHYSDCDRFRDYNYGTRQGDCDCTATPDFIALLSMVFGAPNESLPAATDSA